MQIIKHPLSSIMLNLANLMVKMSQWPHCDSANSSIKWYFCKMKFIGAHVSASEGVSHAPLNAHAIGAQAFALFTRNPSRWNPPPFLTTKLRNSRKTATNSATRPTGYCRMTAT